MSVVRKKPAGEVVTRDYDTSALANAPQQRRSQELSLRILAGAEHVLRREGLAGFTINAVASEAGVSVGGIYGRFKSRDELLSAIRDEVLTSIQHHLEAVADRKFDTLRDVADVFSVELVDVFREVGDLVPAVRSSAAFPTVHPAEGAIRAAFARATQPFRSEIQHPDPELAARLTVHLLLASVLREATTDPKATDRAMGWDTLRRELPHVARAVLTGVY